MKLSIISLLLVTCFASYLNACQDQALCSTFTLEALSTYCSSFLQAPCPSTCGKCASDRIQKAFQAAFNPDQFGNVNLANGVILLRALNINVENAFITEIKDLLLDSKTGFTDLYQMIFDADKNGVVTIAEFFSGTIKFLEFLGVPIKDELKAEITTMAEITRISSRQIIKLPLLDEALLKVLTKLDALPTGLLPLLKFQGYNVIKDVFDFGRIVMPQQSTYTVNSKELVGDILDGLDMDDNGFVSSKEILGIIMLNLNMLDVLLPTEVHQSLNNYTLLIDESHKKLLEAYQADDISELDGRFLIELDFKKFVDNRIGIGKAISVAKQFSSTDVMKYLKSTTTALPSKKLTMRGIKDSLFMTLDNDEDFQLEDNDNSSLSDFLTKTMAKIGGNLKDAKEVKRVFTLYDKDANKKLNSREFMEMFKRPDPL